MYNLSMSYKTVFRLIDQGITMHKLGLALYLYEQPNNKAYIYDLVRDFDFKRKFLLECCYTKYFENVGMKEIKMRTRSKRAGIAITQAGIDLCEAVLGVDDE